MSLVCSPSTVETESTLDVDGIIEQLTAVKYEKVHTLVRLDLQHQIYPLIERALELLKEERMLVRIDGPVHIGSDIHGQYFDLLRLFNSYGEPPEQNYLFLGDYVDRGKQSIETICLLLAYKIKYPKNIYLLRGNHECQEISRIFGFFDECKRRFGFKLWRTFVTLFDHMPVAALVQNRMLCMHGGLSPTLSHLSKIDKLRKPSKIPSKGLLCDLLWSDPARSADGNTEVDESGWGENDRGTSFIFNEKVVHKFVEDHDIDVIVRGHQVVEDGFEFFADKRLVTIFSAPNYCNEFDNDGALLSVSEDLCCSFKQLRPAEKKKLGSRRSST